MYMCFEDHTDKFTPLIYKIKIGTDIYLLLEQYMNIIYKIPRLQLKFIYPFKLSKIHYYIIFIHLSFIGKLK